jgi:hypothetical protein
MDMAIASDIYYKWNNSNAFSLTLRNNATYLKKILTFQRYLSHPLFLG